MINPIRILLVEDEPLWQEGIQTLLESDTRLQLVGITDNYESSIQAFQAIKPKIVLLDWKIKGSQDGLAVGEALLQQGLPAENIVLISGSSPSSIPQHPFLYVPKTQIAQDLIPLLVSVAIH